LGTNSATPLIWNYCLMWGICPTRILCLS